MNRRIVVEVIDDDMAEVLRRKTPAQRLAATHAMWRAARDQTLAVIRHLHPEWDSAQLQSDLRRRLLGSR